MLPEFEHFRYALPKNVTDDVNSLSWVTLDGTKYKPEMVVCIDVDDTLPNFGKIRLIVHGDNSVNFLVNKMKTVILVDHIQAFEIEQTNQWLYISKQNFVIHNPFNIHVLSTGKKVVLCT